MPESIAAEIALWIVFASLGLLAVRLITAPYFIYKEQRQTITNLHEQLNKPARLIGERMAAYEADRRNEMIALLVEMRRLSETRRTYTGGDKTGADLNEENTFEGQRDKARHLAGQMAADLRLQNACVYAINCCELLMWCDQTYREWRDNRDEMYRSVDAAIVALSGVDANLASGSQPQSPAEPGSGTQQ